jgi:hypothetical protein
MAQVYAPRVAYKANPTLGGGGGEGGERRELF